MLIFRFIQDGRFCLGLEQNGTRFDLSSVGPEFADVSSWLALSDPVQAVLEASSNAEALPMVDDVELCAPLDVQEVWASGVTYLRSKAARVAESDAGGDFYDHVYEA